MSDPERDNRTAPEPPSLDGWARHADEQQKAWKATTPRQRLEWLEDAKRFAARAREAGAHGKAERLP